jgi:hypothetical protein
MAQSPSNLAVGIVVEGANQAKAELDALNAKIRLTRTEIQALTKAGDVSAVNALTQAQARNYQEQARLLPITKANTKATQEHTKATVEGGLATREFTKYLIEFGKEAGISNLSARGLKLGMAGLVTSESLKLISEAVNKITELSQIGKETGLDPRTIQGFGRALEEAGGKAEDAQGALHKLFSEFDEARVRSVERFWASSRTAAEQAAIPVTAFDQQMQKLGHDIANYTSDAAGRARFLQDIARDIVRLNREGRIDEANVLSVQLLGKSYRELKEAIDAAASGDVSKLATVTDQATAAAKEYNIALNSVKSSWNDLWQAALIALGPSVTAGLAEIRRQLGFLQEDIQTAIRWWQVLKATASVALGEDPAAAAKRLGGKSIGDTGGGAGAGGGGSKGFLPYEEGLKKELAQKAAGGYIRGPGTGTSDSIFARLSNGEFVLNAGSVRRLGVGFLHGLNNFALGGLVGAPPIRFAEGGLVSAASSSGRPVHLHLGSSSFALSGSSGVVDALVSHAHAQQIRSAGVKPSWFAGRPSGR